MRKRQAKSITLPAPIAGLVENQPTAAKDPLGAEWIENFLPTARGLRMRGGAQQYAYVASPIKTLFDYVDGNDSRMFAATETAIFDVSNTISSASSPNSDALVWGSGRWGQKDWGRLESPIASGFTSGDWSSQQVGVTGGDFLIMVNGQDVGHIFDGTAFTPWTDEAINRLDFELMTSAFAVGETITGDDSGATAEIIGYAQTAGAAGSLYLGAITGTFTDGERFTSAGGAAYVDGAAVVENSITVSGVDTSALSDVWLYRNRLFAVEKDSLRVWYLPAGSVGGTALDFSLAGIFRRGGKLLMGGTWSLDSGDGFDDKCLFISDLGEVAVYSGTDPSDVGTWGLEGRYDIGEPLGKRATMQAGGDLLIATKDGIVPISAAIQQDRAALSLSAVTRTIRDTWKDEVDRTMGNVELHKWTDGNLLVTVFPEADRMLTANLQTGAWAVQTGWHGNCASTFNDDVFVGRNNGFVMKLDSGGTDEGNPFTARLCYAFTDLGDLTGYKVATMARGAYFADGNYDAKYSVATDYNVRFPVAPNVAPLNPDEMVWGISKWAEKAWARRVEDPRTGKVDRWHSVAGAGHSIAPVVQITSGGADKMPVELVAIDLMIEAGGRAA
ncbi:hypothetical protein [Sulfitobacter sp. 1A12157]|uniref:hypothetical protein n=1 Tax=Sulfitobacter sp. 1A12157 TaxID=3368594 RepID=UPI003745E674